MASAPLASTSRAVFASSSSASARMLKRQLLLQAGYTASRPISSTSASTSTVQSRRQQQQQQRLGASHCRVGQPCRHSSSTGKGVGNRALPEEAHVNPVTGLGGGNTEQSFFARNTTNAGGAGKALSATPLNKVDARHAGQTSGSSEVKWIAKQLDMMEKRDNMKNEIPIKQDEDMPFALYVPPKSVPFTPFTEQWWTYWGGRLQNVAQSFRALREVLTLRKYQQNKKKIVTEQFIPLYQSICKAQAVGNLAPLQGRIAYQLRESILTNLRKLSSRHPNATFSWKWHGLQGAKVVTARQVEFNKDQATVQMTVRIESKQSLEIRDQRSQLVVGSGRHDQPQKIVENYVFQKQLYLGEDAPWTAVKPAPTLTPLQAIGKQDRRFAQVIKHKRKPALTVTA